MKKILHMTIILIGLIALVSPVAIGFAEDGPHVPVIPDDWVAVFLPLVSKGAGSFDVSGQVKDAQDMPVSGVTITAGNGASTTTDEAGLYSLRVQEGSQEIEAAKENYDFEPAIAQLDVDRDVSNIHFTGLLQCGNPIPNPGFEIAWFWWNPISGNAAGYTPYYTSEQAIGNYSGFTGIRPTPGWENRTSWSRWRTHEITIPSDATSADVSVSFWPQTTETITVVDPSKLEVGFNTESPNAPTLAGDFYYVAVVDADTDVLLYWLYTGLSNDQAWTAVGPFDLSPWINQEIKLEIGTYNDGVGGVTSAYVDEVIMTVCPLHPPMLGCHNLVLNSDFEAATDWVISPANLPSAYDTAYAFSPVQSMRNGVPAGMANPFPNEWTTSEFYQPISVTIPLNAHYARLKTRLLPRSTEVGGYAPSPLDQADTSYSTQALVAAETQYGYIMDPTAVDSYRLLFKWFYFDSAYWLYREFDLLEFRGQEISVLFGAANDGFNGDTGLWVDDVYLEICTNQ
jgi:hypothetical protein